MVTASVFDGMSALRIDRDGAMSVVFTDGRVVSASIGREGFQVTSAIISSTHLPQSRQLHLQTTRGHNIVVELPSAVEFAPVKGRTTIYLDQKDWSRLANAIHQPDRVPNEREQAAALRLIELARRGEVILPMCSAHMAETCKQGDAEQRYRRALTIVQLSAWWQLRDPVDLRRFELRQGLTTRYLARCLLPPAAVTLEPNAVHAGAQMRLPAVPTDLPPELRWVIHALTCISGIVDTMLDGEHVAMKPVDGWTADLQRFTEFLRDNPSGSELKRRRTHVKFLADLGGELAAASAQVGITPEQMSDWYLDHSEGDVSHMPALGLFREVLHEKLSNGSIRRRNNDLVDMMYLSAGAGYCDHVVGERSHTSHLANALRRLGRPNNVHRNSTR
ncbi:hypothetical protein [Amycolatopsis sp. FDAARGOS 1241]|uniref:hypothetical protein n=1 Tax=Amycolatopsis sp. FDAARGOS 1241 TaxID=2778070 RepID=UPI00194E24DC|nr:hypothetical protein [Amycolatopsis sp. FDAARGOS 1241]QRP42922.1 hypothetical protein I6J71_26045 [Amycolatopsis sp. FDAARGOS 1241]